MAVVREWPVGVVRVRVVSSGRGTRAAPERVVSGAVVVIQAAALKVWPFALVITRW